MKARSCHSRHRPRTLRRLGLRRTRRRHATRRGVRYANRQQRRSARSTDPALTKHALADLIANRVPHLRCVVIEDVHALPKDGPVQSLHLRVWPRLLHGICQVYDLSVVNVPPHVWKSKYGLNSDKHKSRVVARGFPAQRECNGARAKTTARRSGVTRTVGIYGRMGSVNLKRIAIAVSSGV